EGERALFEAYRRNKYVSTGIIQWMRNTAWPSIFWHLFDWYLRPAGGYFGVKKANQPLHVMYSYDDSTVVVVNARHEAAPGIRLRARVLNLDMTEKFSTDTTIDAPADSSLRVFRIPALAGLSSTYFIDLQLLGRDSSVSSNFYWLSTRPDVLNADSTTWYVTPVKSYADYSALAQLPRAQIRSSVHFTERGPNQVAHVVLTNPGTALAFFVRLQIKAGANGDEVLPVTWTDNYVSLLPGESRAVTAVYRRSDLRGMRPALAVSGWNVP
ncbi:MAG TPA: hypothetical protein VF021_07755, partial [Longimicrobiales bacterium]